MDKRKVISAYRRGFITMQECAQILGIDSVQILGMMNDPKMADPSGPWQKQSAGG
ncbi:hypothetical protein [Paenibacillus sp. UNC499MF]|uniref:hypothetical protein n=1 Tax=unclassified Paenibacillus TaxID=185978 RepID=UPI0008A07434|nr:hypothetical protein [Paenibacillus sp. UNC499MF]SEG12351.1 hypothetical protein SAMN02799616_01939 [Paenibacillus sp. UNC499MF]